MNYAPPYPKEFGDIAFSPDVVANIWRDHASAILDTYRPSKGKKARKKLARAGIVFSNDEWAALMDRFYSFDGRRDDEAIWDLTDEVNKRANGQELIGRAIARCPMTDYGPRFGLGFETADLVAVLRAELDAASPRASLVCVASRA